MNGYVCTKPCTLCGVAYSVGDTVPFESVLPVRERALIKQGYISPAASDSNSEEDTAGVAELQARITELEALLEKVGKPSVEGETPSTVVIPITAKGGLLELEMKPSDIVIAVSTLQMHADEAIQTIAGIEQEEVLILIDALETRKTVKAAVADRAEQLNNGELGNKEDESPGDE